MKSSVEPLIHIPPPLVFAVIFVVGLGADRLLPFRPAWINVPVIHAIGWLFIAAVAAIGLLSSGLFIRNRTTIIPHGEPVALVTDGPFRFTRNPMYVSLNLAYVGVSLVLSTLWPLVLLPIPFLFLNKLVIP